MSMEEVESNRKGYCLLLSRVNTNGFSDGIINSDPISNKVILNNTRVYSSINNNNNSHNTTNNNTNTNTPLLTSRKSINSNNITNNNTNKTIESVTYDYDLCLDKVTTNNNEIKTDFQELIINKNNHINQNDIWHKIGLSLHEKWEEKNKSVTLLAVGSHHSGKSYSLFGSATANEEKGIISRFIESLFRVNDVDPIGWGAKYVRMSSCLLNDEEIYDLLDPPKCFSYQGSLCYTDTLDSIIMPLTSPIVSSSVRLEDIFRLSLQSLSVLLSNTIDFFHNHHIIYKFQIFGNEGIQTVTFVELGSPVYPSTIPISVDRFNNKSYTFRSIRAFKTCLKKLPSLSSLAAKKRLLSSSLLTYLLQTDIFLEPNIICLNCIRGFEGSYDDDNRAMSLAKEIKQYMKLTESQVQIMQPYDSLILNLENDMKDTISYLYNSLLEEESKSPGSSGIYGVQIDDTNTKAKAVKSKISKAASTTNTNFREMDKYPGGKHDIIPSGYYYRNKFSYLYSYQNLLKAIVNSGNVIVESFPYQLTRTQVVFEQPLISDKPTKRRKAQKTIADVSIPSYNIIQPKQDLETIDSKLHRWLFSMGLLLPGYVIPKLTAKEAAEAAELSEIEALKAELRALQKKEDNDVDSVVSEHIPELGWAYDPHFNAHAYITMISPTDISTEFSRVLLIPKGYTFIRGSQLQLKDVSIPYATIEGLKVHPYIPTSPQNIERKHQEYSKEESFFAVSASYHIGDVASPTSPQSDGDNKIDRLISRPDVRIVRIHGPEMEPLHCKIRDEHGSLYLSPERLESGLIAKVIVNGRSIEKETTLKDGDIIQLGLSRFLKVNIPSQRARSSPSHSPNINTPTFNSPTRTPSNNPHFSPVSRTPSYNHNGSPLNSNHLQPNINTPTFNSPSRTPSNNPHFSPVSRTPSYNHNGSPSNSNHNYNPSFPLSSWESSMLLFYESWLKDIVYTFEKNRRTVIHLDVNRHLVESTRRPARTAEMNMTSYDPSDEDIEAIISNFFVMDKVFICELIGACIVCNHWSHKLRRGVTFDVNLRPYNPSDSNNRGRIITIPCEVLDLSLPLADDLVMNVATFGNSPNENGRFWLSPGMLLERFGMMKEMWESWSGPWCLQDNMWVDKIYNRALDAFQDNYDDELIGVGFVYLDSLQYLLDIQDTIPIIDVNGNPTGNIKLRIRSWIDQIETLPAYLTVDKECHLNNFLDKKMIICFYFDGLQNLPEKLCSSVYVYFKFFYHRVGFKSIRHSGENLNPILDNIVRVDQRITKDFIQFLKSASLEMEVFGKKKPHLKIDEGQGILIGSPHDNDIFKEMEKREKQLKKDQGVELEAATNEKASEETIENLTDKLNDTLDQLDEANGKILAMTKQLETVNVSTDANSNEALNKQKMENKRLKKAVKDLEEELSKLKASGGNNIALINKGNGSETCIVS